MHHYATNKNKTYTSQFEEIANEYEFELNGDWNQDIFLKLYENLKINIQANPDMLYKDYWNHQEDIDEIL